MISILITSGGTTVPIDPVRNISNNSTGRFGAAIATQALQAGMNVTYLAAQTAESPFTVNADLHTSSGMQDVMAAIHARHALYLQHGACYREHRFQTYDEYAIRLEELVKEQKPSIVILAAAVSDYLIANYSDEKINSSAALQLQLKPAPKLINKIKQWLPETFLVGFKLLVNASAEELLAAASASIKSNNLDLCVANDLMSLQRHAHEILLVKKDFTYTHFSNQLANAVIAECLLQVNQ